jgi:hypothetical protein
MKKYIFNILQILFFTLVLIIIYLNYNNKLEDKTEYYTYKIDSITLTNYNLKILYDSLYIDNVIKQDSIYLLSADIDKINDKYNETIKLYNNYSDSINVIIFKEYLQKYKYR